MYTDRCGVSGGVAGGAGGRGRWASESDKRHDIHNHAVEMICQSQNCLHIFGLSCLCHHGSGSGSGLHL